MIVRPAPITLRPAQARLLSILALGALGLGYLLDAIATDPSRAAFIAISAVKLFGLLGAILLFIDANGQRANAPDRLLDERERTERDRAFVRSHQIIVSGMFLAFLYTVPARPLGWWFPGLEDGIDLLSAYAIASMALPGIILAWRTPESMPDADED